MGSDHILLTTNILNNCCEIEEFVEYIVYKVDNICHEMRAGGIYNEKFSLWSLGVRDKFQVLTNK